MYLMSKLGLLKGLKCYQGCYKSGSASFTYREHDGTQLFEGWFAYVERSATPFEGRRKVTACGQFAEGQKHGQWSYRSRCSVCRLGLVVDYRHGVRHGQYQAVMTEESIPRCVEHRLSLTFVDGLPVGRVTAVLNGYTISGQCDAKGQPIGLWKRLPIAMGDNQRCYYEVWDNGCLRESYYVLPQNRQMHYPCAPTIHDQLCFFVRSHCQPMERRVSGATHSWDGTLGKTRT